MKNLFSMTQSIQCTKITVMALTLSFLSTLAASENLSHQRITFPSRYTPCSKDVKNTLKSIDGAWIHKTCLMKSNRKAQATVGLIEYRPKKNKRMGRLFALFHHQVYWIEYPIDISQIPDSNSCWRVDDGCSFLPPNPDVNDNIPYLIEMKSGIGLLHAWTGEYHYSELYELQPGKPLVLKRD